MHAGPGAFTTADASLLAVGRPVPPSFNKTHKQGGRDWRAHNAHRRRHCSSRRHCTCTLSGGRSHSPRGNAAATRATSARASSCSYSSHRRCRNLCLSPFIITFFLNARPTRATPRALRPAEGHAGSGARYLHSPTRKLKRRTRSGGCAAQGRGQAAAAAVVTSARAASSAPRDNPLRGYAVAVGEEEWAAAAALSTAVSFGRFAVSGRGSVVADVKVRAGLHCDTAARCMRRARCALPSNTVDHAGKKQACVR
jgi:hypothetical protein